MQQQESNFDTLPVSKSPPHRMQLFMILSISEFILSVSSLELLTIERPIA
jgi:hypothetical protein